MTKKKLVGIVGIAALMLSMAGCKFESEITVNPDKTVDQVSTMYYTEEEYEQFADSDKSYTKVEIDGTTFYKEEPEYKQQTWKALNEANSKITENVVIFPMTDEYGLLDGVFTDITVHVPFDIGYTNCEKVDKRTVKLSGNELHDILVAASEKDINGSDVTFKLKSGKNVSNGKIFGASDICTFSDDKSKNEFATFALSSKNGYMESAVQNYGDYTKEVNAYENIMVAKNISAYVYGNKEVITASNGKYTLSVNLYNGDTKFLTYYVDTQAPIVKVKNGKLTFKDKKVDGYASGIKSATVNGKKAKYGMKVKKDNKIVVKDKAGNVTKMNVK